MLKHVLRADYRGPFFALHPELALLEPTFIPLSGVLFRHPERYQGIYVSIHTNSI